MNAAIHPSEHPLAQWGEYHVDPEPAGMGKPNRFRAQRVVAKRIVCVLGSYDSVPEAMLAIDEHMKLCGEAAS
jgi:hypothetical protein